MCEEYWNILEFRETNQMTVGVLLKNMSRRAFESVSCIYKLKMFFIDIFLRNFSIKIKRNFCISYKNDEPSFFDT